MSWIKVEDGYPEKNTKALVVANGYFHIGEYIGCTEDGTHLWSNPDSETLIHGVTEWMPLPEELKKEKKDDDELEAKMDELKEIMKWFHLNGERLRGKYALVVGFVGSDTSDGNLLQVGDTGSMIHLLAEAVEPLMRYVGAKNE